MQYKESLYLTMKFGMGKNFTHGKELGAKIYPEDIEKLSFQQIEEFFEKMARLCFDALIEGSDIFEHKKEKFLKSLTGDELKRKEELLKDMPNAGFGLILAAVKKENGVNHIKKEVK